MEAQLALIKTLRGLASNFGHLDDGQFEEHQIEERFSGISDSTPTAMCWYWIRKLQARFYAGEYDAALAALFKAQPLYWATTSMFESAEFHFYGALSRSVHCDSAPSEDRRQILDDLMVHSQQLRVWAENCPENFENRAALVNAEIARLQGRPLDALDLYEQAIQSARRDGFVHNEALACELAARFHKARGYEIISNAYMRKALSCYARWGADGKVRQLEGLYPGLTEDGREPASTSTIHAPVESLDLATVIKASQAVSGEIVLEKLIDTLMRTAIEHAGAERGLLIFVSGTEQRVAAEATTRGNTVIVDLRDEPIAETKLPELVLHYVLRTGESVILNDAATYSEFAADPYIHQRQARSVLCLPLLNRSRLIGVLYLENNLAPRVFSPVRAALLKLLASHAAIALENAHLYRDLAEREGRIRRLVDAGIIGIFIFDLEGGILEANDAFLRMLGYDRGDLVGGQLRLQDLTPPELLDLHAQTVEEVKKAGTAQPFEKEYFRKDGERVPVLIGGASLESGNQGVAFVLDLTERKRAEKALRESEERFRTLMQFSFDVYWETDAQHRFVRQDFSERVIDGPVPGSELGKTRWELPYLEIDEETWRKHRETLDAHLPFRDLEYARPSNGHKRPGRATLAQRQAAKSGRTRGDTRPHRQGRQPRRRRRRPDPRSYQEGAAKRGARRRLCADPRGDRAYPY